MSKSTTQGLLAVAILVILFLWWKRLAIVRSNFSTGDSSGVTQAQTDSLLSELDQNAPSV